MFHSSSFLFLFPFPEKITEIGEKLSEWLPGGGGEKRLVIARQVDRCIDRKLIWNVEILCKSEHRGRRELWIFRMDCKSL